MIENSNRPCTEQNPKALPELVFNGRFLSRAPSGVDRVAEELIRAFDDLTCNNTKSLNNFTIAVPPKRNIHDQSGMASKLGSRLSNFDIRSVGFSNGHFWEQFFLGGYRRSSWLLSLCNTGPITRKKQLVLIHDAQVFLTPNSYSFFFRFFYQLMLPRLAKRSKIVATVSSFSKIQLEQNGVAPAGKTIVLYNGSDHMDRIVSANDTLKKYNLKKQGFILSIGSLARHKNLKLLALAAESRRNTRKERKPPLVIAGGGDKKIFANAGIPETKNVRFLGRVSDADLKALYSNAIALAFPSITEGFGLPPVEAMRCDCPVIASTGGAIPEICGDAALLIDPYNVEEWTDALERVSHDKSLRLSLIAKGRKRVESLTWKRTAIKLLAALKKCEQEGEELHPKTLVGSKGGALGAFKRHISSRRKTNI